jgi:predicted RNA-binding protein with PIN domain
MKTAFIIDGYNLLHAIGYLVGKVNSRGLERARLQLQDLLAGAFKDQAGHVTVVYDAARPPPKVPREQNYQGLTILLAVGPKEADDIIENLIADHSSPKHLVVVSGDHRLQTAAHRKGAQVLGATEFLDYLDRLQQQKKPIGAEEPAKNEKMSEEEVKDWLQKFAGLEDDPDLKEAFERYDFEVDELES